MSNRLVNGPPLQRADSGLIDGSKDWLDLSNDANAPAALRGVLRRSICKNTHARRQKPFSDGGKRIWRTSGMSGVEFIVMIRCTDCGKRGTAVAFRPDWHQPPLKLSSPSEGFQVRTGAAADGSDIPYCVQCETRAVRV